VCGICGIIYSDINKNVDKEVLIRMTNSLFHRGPDEDGYFISNNIGLGMRRLSIIDVKGGQQPIYNEDKTICVICNGEIYNHLELRELLEKQGHQFSTHSDVKLGRGQSIKPG
jgi:asparagine synthase (glutamine-hydrolysing)